MTSKLRYDQRPLRLSRARRSLKQEPVESFDCPSLFPGQRDTHGQSSGARQQRHGAAQLHQPSASRFGGPVRSQPGQRPPGLRYSGADPL